MLTVPGLSRVAHGMRHEMQCLCSAEFAIRMHMCVYPWQTAKGKGFAILPSHGPQPSADKIRRADFPPLTALADRAADRRAAACNTYREFRLTARVFKVVDKRDLGLTACGKPGSEREAH
jgi:hypothetical protein